MTVCVRHARLTHNDELPCSLRAIIAQKPTNGRFGAPTLDVWWLAHEDASDATATDAERIEVEGVSDDA